MQLCRSQGRPSIILPSCLSALAEYADLVDVADIEHASAKDLIAQIEGSSPEDDHFDARVKVLGEYIDHHVKGEEGEMFPKATCTAPVRVKLRSPGDRASV